ncbi:glycosyl transferase family 1 [Streptomyces sulfonofaciens]|uniref:Glycosyl transferase family 1 n=1 Tax=Streptomyces sulfonofaciens TaxID=68272 RepID=A0A919FP45_9ACTN|nr:glycosyl transferase family 1 [Streptomyces sulfonofaciens]
MVTDLVAASPAEDLAATVACPADGPLAGAVRDAGGAVRYWAASRTPGPALAGEVGRLARLVAQVRPDVVHAHSSKAGLAARLALRGRVPTVFQPHAWSFEAAQGRAARLARRWERYGARWAARIVCVSAAEMRTGQAEGIEADWSVVQNGVDTARFRPAAGPAGDRRAALPLHPGVPPTGPLVVCMARLCRQKGQDVLLQSWPLIARQVPGAHLVLVGDGPEAAALRRAAPPSVTFAGPTRDPAAWYRAADLVVLPSRWEGMALAPLEALACGAPVLVTDVAGAREALPAGQEAHCLVPPADPAALAGAAVALLRDAPLRAELGRAGHRHVLATHDVRRSAAAVAAVYRALPGIAHTGPTRHAAQAACDERRESLAT